MSGVIAAGIPAPRDRGIDLPELECLVTIMVAKSGRDIGSELA